MSAQRGVLFIAVEEAKRNKLKNPSFREGNDLENGSGVAGRSASSETSERDEEGF